MNSDLMLPYWCTRVLAAETTDVHWLMVKHHQSVKGIKHTVRVTSGYILPG